MKRRERKGESRRIQTRNNTLNNLKYTTQEPRDTPHPRKAEQQIVMLDQQVNSMRGEARRKEEETRKIQASEIEQRNKAGRLETELSEQMNKVGRLETELEEERRIGRQETRRREEERANWKSELRAAHEGREAAERGRDRAARDKEMGIERARERADQWQRSGERMGHEIDSMREERKIGRDQLAGARGEIERLNGVIRRYEMERGRRRQEWNEAAELRRVETSKGERQNTNLKELATRAHEQRGEMGTKLTEAYEEIKKLKERLERRPTLQNSEDQGWGEPLGETETMAEPERENQMERVEDLTGSPEVDDGGSTDEGKGEDEGKEDPRGEEEGKDPDQPGETSYSSGSGLLQKPLESGATGEHKEEVDSEAGARAQEASSSSGEENCHREEEAREGTVGEAPSSEKEGDIGTTGIETKKKKRAQAGKGKGKKQGKK